jgi:flagellar basal body-associated protein FliL
MAEAKDKKNDPQPPPKRGLPLKTLLILLLVLLLEAAAITGAFLIAGGPAKVQADGTVEDELASAETLVEELVVADRFPNLRRGRTYLYDTEVYVKVRRKHREQVRQSIEERQAELNAAIGTIFRKAEPSHLMEPTLATITRQIRESLNEVFGTDDEGKPVVEKVVITKCIPFRADL